MSGPLDILCAGRLYADLVFTGLDAAPEPGREVFAAGLAIVAGGGAHITACYGAALGLDCGVFGVLPAAPFDAVVREDLARNGVTAHVTPALPGADPQVTVATVFAGDRAFLTRRPGAALPVPLRLPAARHLHIGELTTALDHPGLIGAARAAGMSVSLDCGWDAAAFLRPEVAAVIASVDVFLPNEDEAARLAALALPVVARHVTVTKRGAAGASALGPGGAMTTAPAASVQVVDTTGAGDAFNAGFLAAWLGGAPLSDCLGQGNACGAVAVGRIGGAGAVPRLTVTEPARHPATG